MWGMGGSTRACTGRGDWAARYRYHRNRLEVGAFYTFRKPKSTIVGEESVTRRRHRVFVFLHIAFHFRV